MVWQVRVIFVSSAGNWNCIPIISSAMHRLGSRLFGRCLGLFKQNANFYHERLFKDSLLICIFDPRLDDQSVINISSIYFVVTSKFVPVVRMSTWYHRWANFIVKFCCQWFKLLVQWRSAKQTSIGLFIHYNVSTFDVQRSTFILISILRINSEIQLKETSSLSFKFDLVTNLRVARHAQVGCICF
jgi:hypothetical protein